MPLAHRPRDLSFALKAGAVLAQVAIADLLFWGHPFGATLGGFALLLVVAAVALRPAVRHDAKARWALAAAGLLAIVLAWAPSLPAWLMFWAMLTLAALLPRAARFDDAWRWSQRLVAQGFVGLAGPWLDARRAKKARRNAPRWTIRTLVPLLALPVLGGAIFLGLFAMANPVIANALTGLHGPSVDGGLFFRVMFWLGVTILAWGVLRPRRRRALPRGVLSPARPIAGVSVASVTLSLVVFNLLFAVQNGLDAVILWAGAGPPADLTLAQYAHRGAYPLIATALLAGLFVLVALDPRRPTARVPAIRALVVAWVAQNLFLVASSILRTVDYVQAYSLTRLRIAALVWMGLVALGLVLICWRMLRGKSAAWLINTNAAAAVLALVAGCGVDLGAVAAAWNVRHARDLGGQGVALDVCYLNQLGPSALASLVEAERRSTSPDLADRLAWVREGALSDLRTRQADWRGWTPRGALRLLRIEALEREQPAASVSAAERGCDGHWTVPSEAELMSPPPAYDPPPEVAPAASSPLTQSPEH